MAPLEPLTWVRRWSLVVTMAGGEGELTPLSVLLRLAQWRPRQLVAAVNARFAGRRRERLRADPAAVYLPVWRGYQPRSLIPEVVAAVVARGPGYTVTPAADMPAVMTSASSVDLAAGLVPGIGAVPARPGHAADVRHQRVFPGEERQLGEVRRWLATVMPDGPARDDLASIGTELGSNAITHSATGHGGAFTVRLILTTAGARIAVTDDGGPGEPRLIRDPPAEHGRGLLLVHGLATRMGIDGSPAGRTVWAEISGRPDDTRT